LEKDPACTNNLIHDPQHQELVKKFQDVLRRWMVDTHDFCLAAFDVRDDPAKLAQAMAQYPKLDKSGGTASEAGEETDSKSPATDDKTAKRKANRAAKKKTQ
jgi:hypothetical protein